MDVHVRRALSARCGTSVGSGEAELGGAVGFGVDLGLLLGEDPFDVAMAGHAAAAGAASLGDAADGLGVGDCDSLADLPFGDTEAPAEILRFGVGEAELHGQDQQGGGGGQVIETESQVQEILRIERCRYKRLS